jgi:hypothetical protein
VILNDGLRLCVASNSKKKEEKEYITYYEDWYGKNWLGEKLINRDNIEGVYNEVETVPEVSFNNETGRSEVVGKKLVGTRLVHYILFSKETVDKIIANSDSDKGEILYKVKSPPNNDYFNYDEFTNYSWEQLENIVNRWWLKGSKTKGSTGKGKSISNYNGTYLNK